jgi:hypothetical protein
MPEKYYRTVFQLEVLSSEPLGDADLTQLDYEISEGRCSGELHQAVEEEVDEPTMARLLMNQRSDPEFLIGHAEGDECSNCQNGTIERVGTEARCCGECGHVWDLRYEPKDREVIFLALHGNKYWTLVHHPVPVEVRLDGMQAWADEHLLPKLRPSGYFKVCPWQKWLEREQGYAREHIAEEAAAKRMDELLLSCIQDGLKGATGTGCSGADLKRLLDYTEKLDKQIKERE